MARASTQSSFNNITPRDKLITRRRPLVKSKGRHDWPKITRPSDKMQILPKKKKETIFFFLIRPFYFAGKPAAAWTPCHDFRYLLLLCITTTTITRVRGGGMNESMPHTHCLRAILAPLDPPTKECFKLNYSRSCLFLVEV